MKKIIGINLIAFCDTKSIGTFVFMKRLFHGMKNVDFSDSKFIVYIQQQIDITQFQIPDSLDVEVVRVPQMGAIKRILFEQIVFYFYLKPCDVLYSPTLSMPICGKWQKILTIHDLVPFVFPKKYNKFRLTYIKWMIRLCAKKVDHIITVSEYSKSDIIKYLHISSDKISIIYNFIPEDEAICVSNVGDCVICGKNNENPLVLKSPFFVTVSTLQPGKNIEGLIRAFKDFLQKHSEYHLYIVGNKGWRYDSIFKIVKELNVTDKIIFTGYIDDANLTKFYSNCYGVIYVSYYEGFGIPPLEGFYHNKACIASETSSIPEVVGKAGVLVNPHDINSISKGIEHFIENKNLLEERIPEQMNKFQPHIQLLRFKKILFTCSSE